MDVVIPLQVIFLFILKHLVCDFFMQGPYQFLNKEKFFHPGGLLHAGINGLGTLIVLTIAFPKLSTIEVTLWLAWIDMALHYMIDFSKMKLNAYKRWKPETTQQYWFSLGADQALHYLTYLLIIYIAITNPISPFTIAIMFSVLSTIVAAWVWDLTTKDIRK